MMQKHSDESLLVRSSCKSTVLDGFRKISTCPHLRNPDLRTFADICALLREICALFAGWFCPKFFRYRAVLDMDRWIVKELECSHVDWCKDFYGNPTEELMPIGFRMFQRVINKEIQFYPMHHLTAASYKYVSCVSLCFWTVQTISERLIQMARFEPFAAFCADLRPTIPRV